MTTKVKVSRSFTFKAYLLNNSEEVLNDEHPKNYLKLLSKSECHYYCEKDALDFFKNNVKECEDKKCLIYKISTLEDSNVKDMLIEQIIVKEDKINIF